MSSDRSKLTECFICKKFVRKEQVVRGTVVETIGPTGHKVRICSKHQGARVEGAKT